MPEVMGGIRDSNDKAAVERSHPSDRLRKHEQEVEGFRVTRQDRSVDAESCSLRDYDNAPVF